MTDGCATLHAQRIVVSTNISLPTFVASEPSGFSLGTSNVVATLRLSSLPLGRDPDFIANHCRASYSMAAIQSKYIPDWVRHPTSGDHKVVLQELDPSGSVTERLSFTKRGILFGRVERVCDVLVSHVSASRVHACVGFDEAGKLQVGDLGSTHGTNSFISCFGRLCNHKNLYVICHGNFCA